MVQLYLETTEDERAWHSRLQHAVRLASKDAQGAGKRADAEDDDEVDDFVMLKAQSQKLQNKIGDLEDVGERRDKQLQKMLMRVDGAMQMLAAVQGMCSQQKKVIDAQQVAIVALREDCGLPEDARGDIKNVSRSPPQNDEEGDDDEADDGSDDDEDCEEDDEEVKALEAEMAAKTAQMHALMEQAMGMQNALAELKTLQAQADAAAAGAVEVVGDSVGIASSAAPASPGKAKAASPSKTVSASAVSAKAAPQSSAEASTGAVDTGAEEDVRAVLSQLHTLESEKARFEGMLRDSQDEHESLIGRLGDMRSLMTRLGMDPNDLDLGDDNDEEEGE